MFFFRTQKRSEESARKILEYQCATYSLFRIRQNNNNVHRNRKQPRYQDKTQELELALITMAVHTGLNKYGHYVIDSAN